MASRLPSRTTSRMSPNTNRSPATVPDRLATSSALPVTRPVAKRLAKLRRRILLRRPRRSRASTALAERDVLSRASSIKLLARSASPASSAASIFCSMAAPVIPQGRIELEIGQSAPDRPAPPARHRHRARAATAQRTPRATLAAMPASAKPSRARFIPENPVFCRLTQRWYAAFTTQPPRRKKGFSGTTRLCRICMSK